MLRNGITAIAVSRLLYVAYQIWRGGPEAPPPPPGGPAAPPAQNNAFLNIYDNLSPNVRAAILDGLYEVLRQLLSHIGFGTDVIFVIVGISEVLAIAYSNRNAALPAASPITGMLDDDSTRNSQLGEDFDDLEDRFNQVLDGFGITEEATKNEDSDSVSSLDLDDVTVSIGMS